MNGSSDTVQYAAPFQRAGFCFVLGKLPLSVTIAVLVLVTLVAHASSGRAAPRSSDVPVIYFLSNGWHTSVGLRRADLVRHTSSRDHRALRAIADDFKRSDFLLFGWGEAEYYRAKKVTPWIAFKATFLVNPSAVLVTGGKGRIERVYAHTEILAIPVSEAGFAGICAYLHRELKRDHEGRPFRLGTGFSADSAFYAGSGKYFLPKTCNVWTAGALKAAGVPVNPTFALAADNVMWRAKSHGRRIQSRHRPVDSF